eukprot:10106831-Karenia_brevis.AAC.1
MHWAKTKALANLGRAFPCSSCGHIFQSSQSLALHRFKAHNSKRRMRLYIDSTSCPICLKQFWTRTRVINHLEEKSLKCKQQLLLIGPKLTPEQADAVDALERPTNRALATE